MAAHSERQSGHTNNHDTVDQVRSAVRGAAKDVRNGIDGIAEDVRHAANNAGTAVRDMADKAVEETSRFSHDAVTYVRKNPIHSAVMSLGVGLLLGAFFVRK